MILTFFTGRYVNISLLPIKIEKEKIIADKDKISHIVKLPYFIENSLIDYNMSSENLNKERWEQFLHLYSNKQMLNIKKDYINNISLIDFLLNDPVDLQSLRFLISQGYDPNAKHNKLSPLYQYIHLTKKFNKNTLDALLDMGFSINSSFELGDKINFDLLNAAITNSNPSIQQKMVNYLASKGLKITNKNFGNYVVSMYNYKNKNNLIQKTLPSIDVNSKTQFGNTIANQILAVNVNNKTISLLLQKNIQFENNGWAFLASAISNENISNENLQKILDLGVNINAVNKDNETPLFLAMRNADIKKVKFLIEHGADLSIRNKKGHDATYYIDTGINIFKKEQINAIKSYLNKLGYTISSSSMK